MEVKEQLDQMTEDLKKHFAKADDEIKNLGTLTTKTGEEIKNIQSQVDALDKKFQAQEKLLMSEPKKTIAEELSENEDVARLIKNKKGRAIHTFKGFNAALLDGQVKVNPFTTPTAITPAVQDAERLSGIVLETRRPLVVRDVLSARPTSLPLIYWVKVNTPFGMASPQTEAAAKSENTVTFTTANSPVKTLATFMKASRQALDDFKELGGFIQAGLPYYVNKAEEYQLLSGDNTGENLNGLITQALAFDVSFLNASQGYTRIDEIGAAIEQINARDEVDPGFVILNKRDWWKLRRTKDTQGRYILGDPQSKGNPTIWDLNVVATNAIALGTFLVGSGQAAASEIRDRMEMEVAISYEDSDNFEKNLVTIRAEKRLVLCVLRPNSYVSGTLSSSPVTA